MHFRYLSYTHALIYTRTTRIKNNRKTERISKDLYVKCIFNLCEIDQKIRPTMLRFKNEFLLKIKSNGLI